MKLERLLWKLAACALVLSASSLCALAQEQKAQTPDALHGAAILIEKSEITLAPAGAATTLPRQDMLLAAPLVQGGASGGGGGNSTFFRVESSFDTKVVKGAPYSAQAITENVQVLADGNRIVRRNTAMVYRDSEGRTRQDQTLSVVGPFQTEGNEIQSSFINDPVTGISYILEPPSRTARKIELPRFIASWEVPQGTVLNPSVRVIYPPSAVAANVQGRVKVLADVNEAGIVQKAIVVEGPALLQAAALDAAKQLQIKPASGNASTKGQREIYFNFKLLDKDRLPRVTQSVGPLQSGVSTQSTTTIIATTTGAATTRTLNLANPQAQGSGKTESLGKQVIEGVEAEGTRTTYTIAAGEIGNEQPINIVTERWYSSELQTTIMTKHNDPRFGENTYKLTNINRSEPARSLFEVPSDYKILEMPAPRIMRTRKPENEN